MIKTNPHSLQIAHIPHGRTSRASLRINELNELKLRVSESNDKFA